MLLIRKERKLPNHHNHGHPNGHIHGHPGHNHGHHHGHIHAHHPHVHVLPPLYPNRPFVNVHRRGSYYGAGVLLICAAVLIPALIITSMLNAASYAATSMTLGAASVGAGAAVGFSAATLGLGALLIYGAVGLGYLYSSAKECYSGNKNLMEMMHSRVVNEDGLSVKGVLKSISSVIWSPFLLIGGLTGMGVKAVVNACSKKSSTPIVDESAPKVEETRKPTYAEVVKGLGLSKTGNEPTKPVHTQSVFTDLKKKGNEEKPTVENQNTFQLN